MKAEVPNKKGCWYFISRSECPLCGAGEEVRERRPAPKPKDPRKRYEDRTVACGGHFC